MENMNEMDLERLALWSKMYGSDMQREAVRESNLTNIALSREASAFSANEASKNRAWQQEMSNTAHQREMADLIGAGLNPILTATGGKGAGIGSGAQGTASLGRVNSELDSNPLEGLSSSVYDARRMRDIEKAQLEANLKNTESNIKVNEQSIQTQQANVLKAMEDIMTQRSQQTVNSALTTKALADATASGEYAKLLSAQTEQQGYKNVESKVKTDIYNSQTQPENVRAFSIIEYLKSWIPFIK